MIDSWGFDHFMKILRKENLPLFGKLKPENYQKFTDLQDGLVKAYGKRDVIHSNFEPEIIGHICAGNILGIAAFGDGGVDKAYRDALKKSGEHVFERIAEFPFWDDYDELLKSDIADLKNIGGRYAGAITAGKFLEHFTNYPYIHLDIAGPAYNKTMDSYRGKGGSGVGVRLFYDFIKNHEK